MLILYKVSFTRFLVLAGSRCNIMCGQSRADRCVWLEGEKLVNVSGMSTLI